MLGYIQGQKPGEADRLLADLAQDLLGQGVSIAGAVQINTEHGDGRKCDMDLSIITQSNVVRISQDLGRMAQGCRLDAAGLERAVGLVDQALQAGEVQLLIINKFGKQEADGRGFRPLIGQALAQGISVLTSVNTGNAGAFAAFAEDMAEKIPASPEALKEWCLGQVEENRT